VIRINPTLNQEEQKLFYYGFRNAVGALRTSIFTLTSTSKDADENLKHYVNTYVKSIEKEVMAICRRVIHILETQIIPNTCNTVHSDAVFYQKMKGDYFRYMSEIDKTDGNITHLAFKAYNDGLKLARESLPKMNQTRIALSLNFSVFLVDVIGDVMGACGEVRATLKDLEGLTCPDDCVVPLQMLKDNLKLWESRSGRDMDLTECIR